MKKYFFILFLFCASLTRAQILCIYCYDQNDSLSQNVNNLLLNGGFEANNCLANYPMGSSFCPNAGGYDCDLEHWTCTGGGPGSYAGVADTSCTWGMVVEGHKAAYLGNYFCFACSQTEYDTSCIGDSACRVTGIPQGYPLCQPDNGGANGVSIEQTVNGLTPGNIYILEFWVGGEDVFDFPDFHKSGIFAVDVGFGKTLLRNKGTAPGTIGTRYVVEFAATSTSHTIKFTNWGHICADCTELMIDDVRLYTIDELIESVMHCSIGIDETTTDANSASLFPNPASEKIFVKGKFQISEISVFNIVNEKVLSAFAPASGVTGAMEVDISMLKPSLYFVEIASHEKIIRKKLIKY